MKEKSHFHSFTLRLIYAAAPSPSPPSKRRKIEKTPCKECTYKAVEKDGIRSFFSVLFFCSTLEVNENGRFLQMLKLKMPSFSIKIIPTFTRFIGPKIFLI